MSHGMSSMHIFVPNIYFANKFSAKLWPNLTYSTISFGVQAHMLDAQLPDEHQALVMQVAPLERAGRHLPPKKQKPLVQWESPMHSTHLPLSALQTPRKPLHSSSKLQVVTHMLFSHVSPIGLRAQSSLSLHITHLLLSVSQAPPRPRHLQSSSSAQDLKQRLL